MLYEITTGWTGPVDIELLSADETPSGTMADMTAELILMDRGGTVLDTEGDVEIPDTDEWTVRYSPDTEDLPAGEYRMRVKVTDGDGKVVFFPSGEWDTLKVWRQG